MGSSEDGFGGEEVNGERVENAVRRAQTSELVRAGTAALAFAMAVVGIWGDGA